MTIDEIIAKYNGKTHNANEWWPGGDPNEVIVELPQKSVWWQFERDINAVLDRNNPVQYTSDSKESRFFLYYSNAVL